MRRKEHREEKNFKPQKINIVHDRKKQKQKQKNASHLPTLPHWRGGGGGGRGAIKAKKEPRPNKQ